jgi:hypothetical protein
MVKELSILENGAMTLPDCNTDETRALKAWYQNELRELQDEVTAIRCDLRRDRALLRELEELVRHITGIDNEVTLQ